ncbi:unnamed protein product [Linum tenue]|uniref:Non-specific lipid-transfer protein n=3 Tax=Linum tenue TaxID=586396 RepID=A0AAV0R434_9ROSI|nr:unnamed protein product [Linum tenue]CAI0552507.1 unnamed protein product [Linum tenue]
MVKGAASMVAVVLVIALAMIQLVTAGGEEGISCGQVDAYLIPCVPYLTTGAGDPAPKCCDGVRSLKANTATADDRRAACGCVKAAAGRYPVKDEAASSLPTKCGVDIGIPISKAIDCQTH